MSADVCDDRAGLTLLSADVCDDCAGCWDKAGLHRDGSVQHSVRHDYSICDKLEVDAAHHCLPAVPHVGRHAADEDAHRGRRQEQGSTRGCRQGELSCLVCGDGMVAWNIIWSDETGKKSET